jgi:glycosyltransferase involved in cell wall biosynthesis
VNISIFGNTNNVPFALAMGFKSLGIDVRLVVNRKEALHRPESRYPEFADGYPPWMLDVSDIPEEEFVVGSFRVGDVINFLSLKADAIVFNSIGPSLAAYCQKPHISFMTGSDVTYYANYKTLDVHATTYDPSYRVSKGCDFVNSQWRHFMTRQRAGIASSACVHVAAPGMVPEIDEIMSQIGVADGQRINNYLTHALDYKPGKTPVNRRFRILNGGRLNWKKPFPGGYCSQDDKGTDVLLKGFAAFSEKVNDGELVLIRKGLHIAETEELARELGISERIIWLDEMNMDEFYQEMGRADIVCDQFGPTTPGLVAMDAMAMEKAVVANFNLPVFTKTYSGTEFLCDAQTAEEVTAHFLRVYSSAELRRELELRSRAFVEDQCSPEAVARVYLERLNLKA